MTIGYVQGQALTGSPAGTSVTTSAFTAISAGDSIVGTVQLSANVNLNSVTDNAGAGNSYVVQQASIEWSTFGVYIALFTGLNIKGSPTTLTLNMSGNATVQGGFDEFSGVGSVNAITVFAENDVTNPSASVTASVAGCAISALGWFSGVGTASASGYSQGYQDFASTGQEMNYLLGVTGSQTANWTENGVQNVLAMVALAPTLLDSIGNPIFRVRGRRWR